MKKTHLAILIVTSYLIFFELAIFLDFASGIIYTMFSLSPFLVIYMVYMVLKYGKESTHTFEERFYDDWDYVRNSGHANKS